MGNRPPSRRFRGRNSPVPTSSVLPTVIPNRKAALKGCAGNASATPRRFSHARLLESRHLHPARPSRGGYADPVLLQPYRRHVAGQGMGRLHPARRGRAGFTGTSFRSYGKLLHDHQRGDIVAEPRNPVRRAVWSRASPLADHAQCMGTPSGRHPRPCFCLCHEPGLHHPDRSFLEFAVHLLALSRRQPAARFQPAALHGRPCRPEGSRKEGGAPARLVSRIHRIGLHAPNAGDPVAAVVGAIAVLHLSAGMAFDAPALRRSAGPSAAHP